MQHSTASHHDTTDLWNLAEHLATDHLASGERLVFVLLLLGYRNVEIATGLEVSTAAVSRTTRRIERKARAMVAS